MTVSSKISEDQILEIYIEAKRRMHLWLTHSTFDAMTAKGSTLRFEMALGVHGGYTFEKPEWMRDKGFNDFVTASEFYTSEYEKVIHQLFEQAQERNHAK
ncbi:MAG: hypothetical protein AAGC45_07975 [Bacteroidota bacterium]